MVAARPSWLRRWYEWTLAWADHPRARAALFFIAVIEASVFPVPPDVLLIAMVLARPESGFRLAAITTAGSAAGAVLGYLIGFFLYAGVAQPILEFYGAMGEFAKVQGYFAEYGMLVVLVAGFSPIPFKVITIAAGTFGLSFPVFILATILSRAARFYLEGALLYWGGARVRELVTRHFELLTTLVVVLLLAGFAGLWLLR